MDKKILKQYLEKGLSTYEIAKLPNINMKHQTISYWIHKYNLQEFQKYKKKSKFKFEKIDNKDKAYILGFILGDGHINLKSQVSISVSLKDSDVVEHIARYINANVNKNYIFNKKQKKFPYANLSKNIKDITKFTGGYTKKERHFPRISNELERYLLLGFFDAEGCITWGRRKDYNRIWHKVSFTSQLKMLLGVQQMLLKYLNIATSITPKTGNDCYVLSFSAKKDVLKFLDYLYQDGDYIILKRKYDKYKALRLELEEFGGTTNKVQSRAEHTEYEGVETSSDIAIYLNNCNSIQAYHLDR